MILVSTIGTERDSNSRVLTVLQLLGIVGNFLCADAICSCLACSICL